MAALMWISFGVVCFALGAGFMTLLTVGRMNRATSKLMEDFRSKHGF